MASIACCISDQHQNHKLILLFNIHNSNHLKTIVLFHHLRPQSSNDLHFPRHQDPSIKKVSTYMCIGLYFEQYYTPTRREGALYCNHLVRPSVHLSIRSHFRNRYLSFYWKKWFYIWYMALAWWLVLCLPFPGLPHIYFLFTVWLTNERVGVFLARRSVQHLVVLPVTKMLFEPSSIFSFKLLTK